MFFKNSKYKGWLIKKYEKNLKFKIKHPVSFLKRKILTFYFLKTERLSSGVSKMVRNTPEAQLGPIWCTFQSGCTGYTLDQNCVNWYWVPWMDPFWSNVYPVQQDWYVHQIGPSWATGVFRTILEISAESLSVLKIKKLKFFFLKKIQGVLFLIFNFFLDFFINHPLYFEFLKNIFLKRSFCHKVLYLSFKLPYLMFSYL